MYRILHTLTVPGMPIENVVVKVLGEPISVAAASSSSDAAAASAGYDAHALRRKDKVLRSKNFSRVLVGDESASMYLTFRSARAGDVKRGRFLMVSGRVTAQLGKLNLLVGPRPDDLMPLKHGVSMGPPAALPNLSDVVHHVGVLLVRPVASAQGGGGGGRGVNGDEPPFALQYGMLSQPSSPRRTLYVGVTLPRSHESFPAAAQRALEESMALASDEDDMEAGDGDSRAPTTTTTTTIWSGLPITEYQLQDGTTHAYHFFLGTAPPASATDAADEEGGGEEEEEEDDDDTLFVWRTHAQVRAAAKARNGEDGRHVIGLIKKARRVLEEAVQHCALRGPGWDALFEYLTGAADDEEGQQDSYNTASALLAEAKQAAASAAAASSGKCERRGVLPVSVLCGFLGSGKTTLLKHILQNQAGWKVAILVNDMAELNIDAALVARVVTDHRQERIVSLSNGCVCCTLREDMLTQILDLAKTREFDYLLIEASGISEPLPIAETFTFTDAQGNAVADLARLDNMVTVVDGKAIHAHLGSVERAAGCEGEDGGDKTLADLWVEQIEFADTLILNKVDQLNDDAELAALIALVRKLNPGARIVPASYGRVDIGEVVNTCRFSLEKALSAPGWLKELRGGHVPETEEYGIASFVYKPERPFHPGRLYALVFEQAPGGALAGLVRCKGFVWLATRMTHMVFWSLAGTVSHSFSVGPHDTWLSASDPSTWPEALDLAKAAEQWRPLWGDRRSEVVFIGCNMDRAAAEAALDACLLTDEEMVLGPAGWRRGFADPFPKIAHAHYHHEDSEEEEEEEEEEWEQLDGNEEEDEEEMMN